MFELDNSLWSVVLLLLLELVRPVLAILCRSGRISALEVWIESLTAPTELVRP